MFKNLRIGVKLTLLTVLGVLGLVMFAGYGFTMLEKVRVNGPLYQQLKLNQELVADILPPPSYIIESYLTASQMLLAAEKQDTASVNTYAEKMQKLKEDFETRHMYWANAEKVDTTQSKALQSLVSDAYTPAQEFYDVYEKQFLPAVQAGQVNQARDIYNNQLTDAYTAHRNVIDKVVNLQKAESSASEAQTNQTLTLSRTILFVVGLATAILMLVLGTIITRSISLPVAQLTQSANEIAHGDLQIRTIVDSADEVGLLAKAFNRMADQLSETLSGLEQRVADRTKALSSVAEVSTAASTILDTDKLLQQVVDLAKERFGFYHAHIYLLDATGTSLVLSSGAGAIGQQMVAKGHAIPLNRERSLVARAAREKKGVTVNDVTTEPDFLPNPLLPDTHSELAVPMMVGDEVIGVFDVQSEVVGRFTDSDIAVQTTLAAQVASAVQNARSYTEIQRSQALLSEALSISRLANWEYDVDQDLFTFNDNFYSIFRTTVEKAGGYKISSADYARIFVHPEDAPLVGSEIQRVLESKERHFKTDLEHRIIYEGGEVGYIAVKINVERDENGKITRWYGANQDVTERRRLEELNRKNAMQQEAINLITQKIQATSTIEEAMQIAARELGHALGQKPTLVALNTAALAGENKVVINE